MKKLTGIFVVAILGILILKGNVYAADKYEPGEQFVYKKLCYQMLDDHTVECQGIAVKKRVKHKPVYYHLKNVVIPKKAKGYKVSSVRYFLAEDNRYNFVESVTIPDSVDAIYDSFYGCKKLKKVKIGKNVKYVNRDAFGGTPFKKKHTKNGQFYFNKILFSVTENCKTLKIKKGTRIIAENAIHCEKIEKISIPASVKFLGTIKAVFWDKKVSDGFYYDTDTWREISNFKEFEVDEKNPVFASRDGVLYNKQITRLISYPLCKSDISYVLPSSVKTIAQGAFWGNEHLHFLKLNEGLETIEDNTLYDIKNLHQLILPKSLTNIETPEGVREVYDEDRSGVKLGVYKGTNGEKYAKTQYSKNPQENALYTGAYAYVCENHTCTNQPAIEATYFCKGCQQYEQCKECSYISDIKQTPYKELAVPNVSIKGRTRAFSVKVNHVKDAVRYEIWYKKGGKSKTIACKSRKTFTKKIKSLKKGKYQVRVRAYVTGGKDIAYSAWTKKKNVRVKA